MDNIDDINKQNTKINNKRKFSEFERWIYKTYGTKPESTPYEIKDVLKSLKYKITPKAFEFIREKNVSFLIMEYLPGESLRKKIIESRGDFSNQFIKDTIIKIAKHIKKMHEQIQILEEQVKTLEENKMKRKGKR